MNTVNPVTIAERNQAEAIHPQASVWVSASAGSGKTKVLTDRVLALLLAGNAPERILCLTFTKAAAAEMSNRIADRLAAWVTADDGVLIGQLARLLQRDPTRTEAEGARQLFARVLDAPGGLRILTIHAFCQSVLRRFPLEAGIAPHFKVMDERDSAEALAAAQEATIAHARGAENQALPRALALVTERVHELNFTDLMNGLVAGRAKLGRALEHHGSVDAVIAATGRLLGLAPGETEESVIAAACAEAAFDRSKLRRAAEALDGGSDPDRGRAAAILAWLTAEDRTLEFADHCRTFLTQEDAPRALRSLATKKAQESYADLATVMLAEADRLAAAKQRLKAVKVFAASEALVRIGAHMLALYRADKERRGMMDYDDLIERTRRLLERPGSAAWVLFKLDGGIDHLLIDEAQDTNPEQWAIVRALTAEFFAGRGRHEDRADNPRTVFGVGDPKQSIYGFQGADPQEFVAAGEQFRERTEGIARMWRSIALNVSFRSTPAVLDAVDAVFAQSTARDGLGDELIAHLPAREGHGGLVEIWPLVEPAPRDDPPNWKPPVERTERDSPPHRLAGLIAARIARMIRESEILEAKGRPVRPGDIMVLVRRRTGFIRELVRQLKIHDVPVAGVDRMVLTEQLAVMDLMALGDFLLLPDDDLTLATVLKGPLVGLTEDELFTLAYDRGPKRLWSVLAEHAGAESRLGKAHALLEDLLARTDYLPPADLYGYVLVACGGRRKLLARLGPEADDPIDEFLALALTYQRSHPPSLQGFLHWLAAGETEIKRDLEQSGSDAVRIITAHGAKGLQAPIVFLPDTCQPPTLQDRILWSDGAAPLLLWAPAAADQDPLTKSLRDAAQAAQEREYRRLLYVAMTRAEDRLYICGWQTRRPRTDGTWYALIKSGLGQLARFQPVSDAFLGGEVLRLTSPQTAKIVAEIAPEPLREPQPPPAWALTEAPTERAPPVPLAPSTAARAAPPVLSPLRDDGVRRFQRGIVIHRLLQVLPEIAPNHRAAAGRTLAARPAWGLDATTQADVVRETLAVIDDPRFAAPFGPGSRAEVPLTGVVGAHVLSAQVDRLAVSATEVWVIDYKTNRPPPSRIADVDPAYMFQMASYRAALQAIYPARAVRCALLWTDGPFAMELSPGDLERALNPN